MKKLVYGHDEIFMPWICARLNIQNPHPCTTIGVVDSNNQIKAVALYNNQQLDTYGKPYMIEISFATIDKSWASRAIIYGLLNYPFSQLRLRRVQSTVSKRNRTVRAFLEHLGFKYEGTGRQAWPAGGDACMYSLLSNEFFSSKWNIEHEQIKSVSTSST